MKKIGKTKPREIFSRIARRHDSTRRVTQGKHAAYSRGSVQADAKSFAEN